MTTPTPAMEAEKYVIGAILREPERLQEAIEHITGHDFANRRLGAAYDIAVGHRGTQQPIDILTIAQALTERGYQTNTADLFDLYEAVPAAASIVYYAKIVADAAAKRPLKTFAARTAQAVKSADAYADVMTDIRGEWEHLTAQAASSIEAVTLAEILDGPDDYDWIIPNLLERQDRLVITGGEGSGKSFLVQQIAILAAAGIHPTTFQTINPIRVLVVDAENSAKQWRRRVRPLVWKAQR